MTADDNSDDDDFLNPILTKPMAGGVAKIKFGGTDGLDQKCFLDFKT